MFRRNERVTDPLYREFSPRGVAREGERGFTAGPEKYLDLAEYVFQRAVAVWEDGDIAPWLHAWLVEAGVYDSELYLGELPTEEQWQEEAPFAPDELPTLLGLDGVPLDFVADLLRQLSQSVRFGLDVSDEFIVRFIAWQLLDLERAGSSEKPRLVLVSKDEASDYIAQHHSKLPQLNFRGLMYCIGVKVRDRLAAVGTAGHPTARWSTRGESCSVFGMLELTRIASDGTVRGASSMIASRMIDLLAVSGRRGVAGCLFITYSLLSEAGTTYLALVDKGLRPVEMTAGKKPGGARKHAGLSALPQEAKIRWEAGSAAIPPDWEVLLSVGNDPARIANAERAFAAWQARDAKERAKQARRVATPGQPELA